ncbi:hypothetical protein BJV74DRAFT_868730 [Russula compacta]|nr:hypothetical protein BJV74DRAFT_868730 [Russula compacta]
MTVEVGRVTPGGEVFGERSGLRDRILAPERTAMSVTYRVRGLPGIEHQGSKQYRLEPQSHNLRVRCHFTNNDKIDRHLRIF